jgi:hypothetical protein
MMLALTEPDPGLAGQGVQSRGISKLEPAAAPKARDEDWIRPEL